MKIIEHTLTEDLSNFTDQGIPAEFAKNILRKFRIDHDVEIQEIDGKPKTSDIDDGDMIINLLPNGSVIAVLKVHIDARFRASYKEYHRLTFADGEFSREWTTKVGAATKGITARGKFFRISNRSIRYSNNPDRDDKPTPDEIKDRSTNDPLAGKPYFDLVAEYLLPYSRKSKNEEAAGVGIVTKQNATRDVPVGGEYMNVGKLFPKNQKKKRKGK